MEIKERIEVGDPEIITELFLAPYRYFSPLFWERGFKTMLDVGCGNGIGTDIMKRYFPQVIGVDKELLAMQKDFIQADVTNLHQFQDDSFDGAFCFETIEHIDGEGQKKLVLELNRVCKKGFVIGSINKDGPDMIKGVEIWKGEKNKYHLKELTIDDFVDIGNGIEGKKYAQYYGSRYDRTPEVVRIDILVPPYSDRSFSNYVQIIK